MSLREDEIKSMIKHQLRQASNLLHGHKVYLFGSRAKGNARPRSDFDLGIWGDKPLSLTAFYKLEDMLDELPTLYKIDLVDLCKTNSVFRKQALKEAELLYE